MPDRAEEPDRPRRIEWLADAILDAADGAGIGITVTVADPTIRQIYATPAAARIFGVDVETLCSVDSLATFGGQDRERIATVGAELASTGAFPSTLAANVVRADGVPVSIEVAFGGIQVEGRIGVVTFLADVSDRQQALGSLRAAEERFSKVVESLPEIVLLSRSTRTTYGNPAARRLLNLPASQSIESLDLRELIDPADQPRLEQHLRALAPGSLQRIELRLRVREERTVILEASTLLLEDEEGTILWFGRDVTEQKQIEARLLQADRLATLGTLAGGMAHAINNPLSYTLLNLEHVTEHLEQSLKEPDSYSELRVRLTEAHEGAERIAKIVRQMRSLSRGRASEPGPVSVTAALETVLAMVDGEIRHRGQLTLSPGPVPLVWAREEEIEQALLSLLIHAARALPDRPGLSCRIHISTGTAEDGSAVVTVMDEGTTLHEPHHPGSLDPFAARGVGPGLALCHAIVTSLEGGLHIEHVASGGTLFRVHLRAAPEQPVPARARVPSTPPPPPGTPAPCRARVLVIDDEPNVASSLCAMLEGQHDVVAAESGQHALELLLESPPFDIVFCDLMMPEMSGIELYRVLAQRLPGHERRFVFMTGGVFTPEADAFLAQVPNPRIEKPFKLTRIEQLVARAIVTPAER